MFTFNKSLLMFHLQFADETGSAAESIRSGLSLDEAKQILNVEDINDKEAITKNYEHLFNVSR